MDLGHDTQHALMTVVDLSRLEVELEIPESYADDLGLGMTVQVNIGTTQEVSIRELAERVKHLAGSDSLIQYIPYDQAYETGFEDMPRRVPDISKITALIGFQPKLELDDIIRTVIEFTRNN